MELLGFVLAYSFIKCLKTMLCGSACMAAALFFCRINKNRHIHANVSILMFVPLMVLTAYSRLFLMGKMFYVGNWMIGFTRPEYGAVYFGVAGCLFIAYVVRSIRLNIYVRHMELLKKTDGVKIYVCKEKISPFSCGLLRPCIVLPESLVNEWSAEDVEVIVSHELKHIRSGHIWMLMVYKLVKIYWWANPLIYLCDRRLRENMEYLCDAGSLYETGVSGHYYGLVMLRVLRMQRDGHKKVEKRSLLQGQNVNFAGNDFDSLEKRITRLKYCGGRERGFGKRSRRCFYITAVLFAVTLLVIRLTSCPRYTQAEEITLLDAKLQIVLPDVQAAGFDIQAVDGELVASSECMEALLKEYQLSGDYVFFSYGIITKMPGVGGGGQVAMVSTDDVQDIWYLAMDCRENRWSEFVLKYLI